MLSDYGAAPRGQRVGLDVRPSAVSTPMLRGTTSSMRTSRRIAGSTPLKIAALHKRDRPLLHPSLERRRNPHDPDFNRWSISSTTTYWAVHKWRT